MPGGLVDQRGRRGLMEIEVFWQAVQLPYGKRYILGIGAPDRFAKQVPIPAHIIFSIQAELTFTAAKVGVDDNIVASLQSAGLACPVTERYDFSRPIRAVDVRQLQLQTGPAVAHHHVHAVERRGA